MNRAHAVLTVGLLAGPIGAQDGAPDAPVDVASLVRRQAERHGPAIAADGLLLEPRADEGGVPSDEREGVADIDEGALAALVERITGRGSAQVADGWLRIVAPPDVRSRALALVEWLRVQVRPTGTAHVEWLDLPPATALRLCGPATGRPPVFDAARWAEACAACAAAGTPIPTPHARATLRMSPGRRSGVGERRERMHVWDYETEVTGATRAAHPLVRACATGWRVDVRPGARERGGAWLAIRGEAITLAEPDTAETGHGRVSLPAPLGTVIAAAAGLRDGERILLGASEAGLGGGYLVLEWRADPVPADLRAFPLDADELRSHDADAWAPTAIGAAALALGDDQALYPYEPWGAPADDGTGSWRARAGSLVEAAVGAHFGAGVRGYGERSRWVAAPRRLHDEIERRLAEAATAWRPVWVEAVLVAGAVEPVSSALLSVPPAAVLAHAIVAATPEAPGSAARVRRRPRLADHEVEVAPTAMVDDPVIRTTLEGFTCDVHVRPGAGERVALSLRVSTGRLREPAPTHPVRPAAITHLDVDVAEATWELDLAAGQWAVRPWPAGADGRPRTLAVRATRG